MRGSWLTAFWNLPVIQFFAPLFGVVSDPIPDTPAPAILPAYEAPHPAEPCSVTPLDPIEDPATQQLEADAGSGIDVSNMRPAAARALDRFESKVNAVGGTMVLKSAFRPAAYQQHLQNVWFKWMRELRNNQEPGCQEMRAQVRDEFLRHRLLETQHPVTDSDHTRGLAFDALVALPGNARLGRRRVSVDTLARSSGLMRPVIVADPVHFKYVGSVGYRVARRRNT